MVTNGALRSNEKQGASDTHDDMGDLISINAEQTTDAKVMHYVLHFSEVLEPTKGPMVTEG